MNLAPKVWILSGFYWLNCVTVDGPYSALIPLTCTISACCRRSIYKCINDFNKKKANNQVNKWANGLPWSISWKLTNAMFSIVPFTISSSCVSLVTSPWKKTQGQGGLGTQWDYSSWKQTKHVVFGRQWMEHKTSCSIKISQNHK